ncbi:MAG: LacI family DNA-binding transcriptional regulator [Maritimibacter sp.]|jgi:LacI family transcriptional regulator
MMDKSDRSGGGFRSTGKVTIKTVAKSLGLSPSTVSRALRNDPSVTEATSKRIRDAAEAMGYTRDLRGVNLRTGQTNAICVLMLARPKDEYGDPAAMQLIKGLISGVSGGDKTIVFRIFPSFEEQFEAMREMVAGRRFDGVIFDHTVPQDPRVKYLLEQDFPFLTFGRTELFSQHAYFDVDNEESAYLSTKEVIGRGCKRIALITPPLHFLFGEHWHRGYQRALREAGIEFDPALTIQPNMELRSVEEMSERICSLDEPPDAFVSPNEMATTAAIRACEHHGLDIEKIAFISLDGTRFFDFFRPGVSSIYCSTYTIGERLSQMMIRLLDGEAVENLQEVVVGEIIRR